MSILSLSLMIRRACHAACNAFTVTTRAACTCDCDVWVTSGKRATTPFHSTTSNSWDALLYVERNPVRAGLVATCGEWRWSTTQGHLGMAESQLLDLVRLRARFDPTPWERYLPEGAREAQIEDRIREATLRGRFESEFSIRPPRKAATGEVASCKSSPAKGSH